MCALWCNCVHCLTRYERLLVFVLPKSCAIIVLGIQVASVIQSGLRRMYVLDRMLFAACPYVFYHVLLTCHFIVCFSSYLAKDSN